LHQINEGSLGEEISLHNRTNVDISVVANTGTATTRRILQSFIWKNDTTINLKYVNSQIDGNRWSLIGVLGGVSETKGTFTPVLKDGLTSFNFTVNEANFTKTGSIIYFNIWFSSINSTSFTPSSFLNITGLPFASSVYNYNGSINIIILRDSTLTSSEISEISIYENGGTLFFQKRDGLTLLVNTDFTNGRLAISGSYMI